MSIWRIFLTKGTEFVEELKHGFLIANYQQMIVSCQVGLQKPSEDALARDERDDSERECEKNVPHSQIYQCAYRDLTG